MLKRLSEIILRSKIEKDNSIRNRRFLPWDSIEKIALIIDREQALNKNAIDKYIARTEKHVEVFHIELGSKEPSYGDWECFARKDKSLLHLPKKRRLSTLRDRRFDLVINTCSDTELFPTAVSSSLNATLKCGPSSRFNDTDLIIKRSEPADVLKYLDDIVAYLKMIKP